METLLVLLHTEPGGGLSPASREALSAARKIGVGGFCVGLVGPAVKEAADRVAGCGADRFLAVEGDEFEAPRYGTDAAAAEALCRVAGATLVFAPATSRWSRVLAAVAQRLDGRADTHVTSVASSGGSLSVTRWYYRQRMEAVLSRDRRPWLISLEPGSVDPWEGPAGAAVVEPVAVDVPAECLRARPVEIREPAPEQRTIRPDAELLFVAGAGWTKKQKDGRVRSQDAERLILDFLARSGASLGGSKSLVEIGGEGQAVLPFMTHLNQVGQTGSAPRHRKGLSTCCHGEEPHAVGWRFIAERRAVNLDPSCGWTRGKADVVYVADSFEVMERVNALLGSGQT